MAVAVVSGCNDVKFDKLWNDLVQRDDAGGAVQLPPRPPANAASESLVLVSGGAQTDISGLIENSVIIGEPFQAGSVATGGTVVLRHGFLPPIPPGWPVGIAKAAPSGNLPHYRN